MFSASVWKIKNVLFLDTLIQKIHLETMKMASVQGDLTDTIAKIKALFMLLAVLPFSKLNKLFFWIL